MKEEKNETGAWLKVEDLYGDDNPKEGPPQNLLFKIAPFWKFQK